ncbi:hypothetical protein [Acidiphilium iwatense]|uniref:Uncharacterized protein n=1 Tax=Acidiphilium iwatense TaxID=768198 RepID=A0ABS9E1P6_9PROT|nr:hypothetical protein [Acidiphilium iwatense]MCF3948273.1 hypothetical protein [Acidiphilium iwatense]
MEPKPQVHPIISQDIGDLMKPGVQVEIDKADIARLGLCDETAVSEDDAWDSNGDEADRGE